MLSTEGTYPFHEGGVSTWCDLLVKKLEMVDYHVFSVVANPFVLQKFDLQNESKLTKVPLWGTEEPSEHLSTPFSAVYVKKQQTTEVVVKNYFLPLFKDLIQEIISPHKNAMKFGETILRMYRYFKKYEYKETFKSEAVWSAYKEIIMKTNEEPQNDLPPADLYGLIQSIGWVYRFLTIVNTPVPKVDVTHSAASAFCGIPCVIAKLEHNTPFLLTEHGVYLREQYLSLANRDLSPFLNRFLMRFIHAINAMNYYYADQVSPVCQYNQRWESRLGLDKEKIKVIYNGVDDQLFTEDDKKHRDRPTVVTVARIDPIKDIKSLLKCAHIVQKELPNVKFIVYGSISVQAYYEECLELRKQLDLEHTFIFAGHTSTIVEAYHSGDVVALSSISEAFPYSVIEGMMTGKPIVATDVGGVKEALGDCGILVKTRDYKGMATALTSLLKDKSIQITMGKAARKRAIENFTLERVLELHLKSYLKLAIHFKEKSLWNLRARPPIEKVNLQLVHSEKAYAFDENGLYYDAIEQFQLAIQAAPDTPGAFVYKAEIAKLYTKVGDVQKAKSVFQELQVIK